MAYLYVPGDRPDRFEKALASGADAVIFDLEDAVAIAAKADARAAVVEQLHRVSSPAVEHWVRINAGAAGFEDLEALADLTGLTGVFVPKASVEALMQIAAVSTRPCCALVETAAAVIEVARLAASDNVVALAMGEVDLVAELAIEPTDDEHELWPFRMQVVAASAHAQRRAPIGPIHANIKDTDGLRRTTLALRRAGFGSRQAVHPTQVGLIQEIMTPTAEEIERAHVVIRLADAAEGGVCVDDKGRMVDEAVLRSARRTLARIASRDPTSIGDR